VHVEGVLFSRARAREHILVDSIEDLPEAIT
jgi:hypothetical protein